MSYEVLVRRKYFGWDRYQVQDHWFQGPEEAKFLNLWLVDGGTVFIPWIYTREWRIVRKPATIAPDIQYPSTTVSAVPDSSQATG